MSPLATPAILKLAEQGVGVETIRVCKHAVIIGGIVTGMASFGPGVAPLLWVLALLGLMMGATSVYSNRGRAEIHRMMKA